MATLIPGLKKNFRNLHKNATATAKRVLRVEGGGGEGLPWIRHLVQERVSKKEEKRKLPML